MKTSELNNMNKASPAGKFRGLYIRRQAELAAPPPAPATGIKTPESLESRA
jgi:hypothetical protein